MAQSIDAKEEQRLRDAFQADAFRHDKFLAQVETTSNFRYTIPFKHRGEDKKLHFRRWNHEEATRIYTLPFFGKLALNKELTDDEEKTWFAFKIEIIMEVIEEKTLFNELIMENDQLVEAMYNTVAFFSGISNEFDTKINDFMESKYGYLYGLLWFQTIGKTPSEIASLPESDVKTIQAWIIKAVEKMPKNVV